MTKNRYPVFILTCILICLAAVIAGGTAYALLSGKRPNRTTAAVSGRQTSRAGEQTADFSGLGLSRFSSAGEQPCVIIAAPYFRYDPSDLPFVEELAKKTRLLNNRIGEWFAGFQPDELTRMDEAFIKEQLTALINKELVLGSIEMIYFDEFLIIQ